MTYLVALLLSAFLVNGVHLYLLVSTRSSRKPTISEHAALDRNKYVLYVFGHLLGGSFALIFAKLYYLDLGNTPWLFFVLLTTVVFEYIQAFLPARGSTNKAHTQTALIMWASFITFGLLNIIFLHSTAAQKLLASVFYVGLALACIKAILNQELLYKYQMLMVALFYAAIFTLVF